MIYFEIKLIFLIKIFICLLQENSCCRFEKYECINLSIQKCKNAYDILTFYILIFAFVIKNLLSLKEILGSSPYQQSANQVLMFPIIIKCAEKFGGCSLKLLCSS